MASRREQAGLLIRSEMLPMDLDLLRHMPMPAHRLQIGDASADQPGRWPLVGKEAQEVQSYLAAGKAVKT